jgi:hypothetical protein
MASFSSDEAARGFLLADKRSGSVCMKGGVRIAPRQARCKSHCSSDPAMVPRMHIRHRQTPIRLAGDQYLHCHTSMSISTNTKIFI